MDGRQLREWRRSRGLTQAQLARLLYVSRSMVSQMERGVRPIPTRPRPLPAPGLPPKTDEPSVAEHIAELDELPDGQLREWVPEAPRGPYR